MRRPAAHARRPRFQRLYMGAVRSAVPPASPPQIRAATKSVKLVDSAAASDEARKTARRPEDNTFAGARTIIEHARRQLPSWPLATMTADAQPNCRPPSARVRVEVAANEGNGFRRITVRRSPPGNRPTPP